MRTRVTLGLLLAVLFSDPEEVRGSVGREYRSPAAAAYQYDHAAFVDANQVLMFVSNTGSFARDIESIFPFEAGLYFPYTSTQDILSGVNTNSLIYSAGLWIGGKVQGDIRVTVAEYSQEYFPGPTTDSGYVVGADDDPTYRVYKLYADSLEDNPNVDYLSWPVELGAPVDRSGHPLLRGRQTLWTVYNDANPALHTSNAGGTSPLGVEVRQLVWATDRAEAHSSVYMQYNIYNKGSNIIDSCYLSIWMDPDLGGFDDDVTGCDSTKSTFFCYNFDNDDRVYGLRPPAFGCKVISGPLVPSVGDTALFGLEEVYNCRNLPLCSFQVYGNGGDIRDPDTVTQSYNLMTGLRPDGSTTANGTLFRYPGDPVSGIGELDPWPGDRRMMGSCGPFALNPGDSQSVLIKLCAAQDRDRLRSLALLKKYLEDTTGLYGGIDSNPAPPVLPADYILFQNYPNPFNPATTIVYTLPQDSHVTLDILNMLGQNVKTLVDSPRPAGEHAVSWDGTNSNGSKVSSGVYFYRLTANGHSSSKKMILIR